MHNGIRRFKDRSLFVICGIMTLFGLVMLFGILLTVFSAGLPSLTPYFIFTPESETPGIGQGIANAIVGSILLSLISTVIATPFALATAIYLQKYAPDNYLTRAIRFFIEVLSGTPSIVVGAFGLLLLVTYLRTYTGGFSLIAGSIGLSILILPVIERAIEDAIAMVPRDLEEGSYALGTTKWQTVRGITLPAATSGIATGTILGFGRAAEESAVVILTAGYTQFMPELAIRSNDKLFMATKIYPFQDLVGSLPYAVYHAYEHSNVIPVSNAFACALILISLVMIINVGAKTVFWLSTRTVNKKRSPLLYSLRKSLFRSDNKGGDTRHADSPRSSNPPAAPQGSPSARVGNPSHPTPSDWTLALTQPIPVASSQPSEKTIATPHPASTQANPSGPLPVDGLLAVSPAAAGHSLPPAAHGCGDAGYPDLLEDDPDGPAEPDPGSTRRTRHPAGAELLEEPHIPLAETWRSMTKNQQENMHV